jgi:hypothetical protein
MSYQINKTFSIRVGFDVRAEHVAEALLLTNGILTDLPASLYRSLDFKTISSIVGSIFSEALASQTRGIVNPIEKGHPDIVPPEAKDATEAKLRNYPRGLEIKCTVGNIENGANLRAGQKRVSKLVGITWQAHHREVNHLMVLFGTLHNRRIPSTTHSLRVYFTVISLQLMIGAIYQEPLVEIPRLQV